MVLVLALACCVVLTPWATAAQDTARIDVTTAALQQDLPPLEAAALQQDLPPLTIRFDATTGYGAVLRIGPVFQDAELEEAARSGLPIRIRVRVELWKDRLFDQLVDSTGLASVILFEPIENQFVLRTAAGVTSRYASYASVRQALETAYVLPLQPPGAGRFYYTATLQIETLSLTDLAELERWLQRELQPAVSGEQSIPGAIGQGARRLLIRLLDLPARRYDARTERFRIE